MTSIVKANFGIPEGRAEKFSVEGLSGSSGYVLGDFPDHCHPGTEDRLLELSMWISSVVFDPEFQDEVFGIYFPSETWSFVERCEKVSKVVMIDRVTDQASPDLTSIARRASFDAISQKVHPTLFASWFPPIKKNKGTDRKSFFVIFFFERETGNRKIQVDVGSVFKFKRKYPSIKVLTVLPLSSDEG